MVYLVGKDSVSNYDPMDRLYHNSFSYSEYVYKEVSYLNILISQSLSSYSQDHILVSIIDNEDMRNPVSEGTSSYSQTKFVDAFVNDMSFNENFKTNINYIFSYINDLNGTGPSVTAEIERVKASLADINLSQSLTSDAINTNIISASIGILSQPKLSPVDNLYVKTNDVREFEVIIEYEGFDPDTFTLTYDDYYLDFSNNFVLSKRSVNEKECIII